MFCYPSTLFLLWILSNQPTQFCWESLWKLQHESTNDSSLGSWILTIRIISSLIYVTIFIEYFGLLLFLCGQFFFWCPSLPHRSQHFPLNMLGDFPQHHQISWDSHRIHTWTKTNWNCLDFLHFFYLFTLFCMRKHIQRRDYTVTNKITKC